MKFNSLIQAVKAIRQAGYDTKPNIARNLDTGIYEIKFTGGPSLYEAKEIVEACMAFGVREYLEAELRYSRKIYQDDDPKDYLGLLPNDYQVDNDAEPIK